MRKLMMLLVLSPILGGCSMLSGPYDRLDDISKVCDRGDLKSYEHREEEVAIAIECYETKRGS